MRRPSWPGWPHRPSLWSDWCELDARRPASAVLVWRFQHERVGAADAETPERRAALAVGLTMIGVALYLGARAISALSDHAAPETSSVGIILSAGSAFVLPVLARAKLRLAAQLQAQPYAVTASSALPALSWPPPPWPVSSSTRPWAGGGRMRSPPCSFQRCSSPRARAPSRPAGNQRGLGPSPIGSTPAPCAAAEG